VVEDLKLISDLVPAKSYCFSAADPVKLMHDLMLISIGLLCMKQHTSIEQNGASS
jgi:hypothetical protein